MVGAGYHRLLDPRLTTVPSSRYEAKVRANRGGLLDQTKPLRGSDGGIDQRFLNSAARIVLIVLSRALRPGCPPRRSHPSVLAGLIRTSPTSRQLTADPR